MNNLLVEKSPEDLKAYNRQSLIAMGASGSEVDRLLGNPAYTPTQQTAFVLNMKSLDGVANRKAFIRLAGMNSSADADAIFCVQTAAMLGKLHQEIPLARWRPAAAEAKKGRHKSTAKRIRQRMSST
jgi:hypothetical protein